MSHKTGECHNCIHNGRQSPACLSCGQPAELGSHHGTSVYSIEAMREAGKDPQPVVVTERDQTAFGAAMRMFLQLSERDMHIIARRYLAEVEGDGDHTYELIGAHLGCSRQNVEQRHAAILRKFPALEALFLKR